MNRIAGFLAAAILTQSVLANAEDGKLKIAQIETKISPKEGKLEATFAYDTDGDTYTGFRLGLKATLPTRDVDGSPQASLGDFPNSWAIGPSIVMEYSSGRFDDGLIGWLELAPQWSAKSYSYQPIGETERNTYRHSIVGQFRSVNFWNRQSLSFPMGLDVLARFGQEWTDAEKVGLVTPAEGTQPALVEKSQILSPPTTGPALTLRAHAFLQVKSTIALGPAVTYLLAGKKTTSGDIGSNFSSKTDIIRSELWLYYLAPDAKPANLRVGASPYFDFYAKGLSPDNRRTDFGFLVQLKASTPMFGY